MIDAYERTLSLQTPEKAYNLATSGDASECVPAVAPDESTSWVEATDVSILFDFGLISSTYMARRWPTHGALPYLPKLSPA
jgi:hypothetical protein